jgi:endonuclease/exonuclease/phosphatase family metal-dependent hydrolase
VLGDVLTLHGKAHLLLRSGRQRLHQTRDLLRLNGAMLAHASVLLGDLGKDQAAEDYGHTALIYLHSTDERQRKLADAVGKVARAEFRKAKKDDNAGEASGTKWHVAGGGPRDGRSRGCVTRL